MPLIKFPCVRCKGSVSTLGSFVKTGILYTHVECYDRHMIEQYEASKREAAEQAAARAREAARKAEEERRMREATLDVERQQVREEERTRLRAAQAAAAQPLIEQARAPNAPNYLVQNAQADRATLKLPHDFNERGICKHCTEGRASLKGCTGPKAEEPKKDRFELIDID